MNAAITAYAQAQQIAGRWIFNEAGCYQWETEEKEFELEITDEGYRLFWLPCEEDTEPVLVSSLKQLKALMA